MEGKMQTILEKIGKEAKGLSPDEQLELVENLVHQLRERELEKGKHLNWGELYGLGKGLWEGEDAQEYVTRLREDRGQ